jgi:TadE-like protein
MCAGPVTPSTGPAHTFSEVFAERDKITLSVSTEGRHNADVTATPQAVDRGRRQRLMLEPNSSDRSLRRLVKIRDLMTLRRRQNPESGQATTEFALILFPLLILVAGIIYFGIGLNYWLDMQRIANQGARWAAVNNWPPDCPVGSTVGDCDGSPYRTLQESLKRMAIADGLESSVTAKVCYPTGNRGAGEPVRVRLESDFTFFFIDRVRVKLVGEATMRLEQSQEVVDGGLITGEVPCP